MKTHRFFEASAAEHAAWAGLPMTAAFFDWLEAEADAVRDEIADEIAGNRVDNARVLTGQLRAMQGIALSRMRQAERPKVTEDEAFVDPATRPSVMRAKLRNKGKETVDAEG